MSVYQEHYQIWITEVYEVHWGFKHESINAKLIAWICFITAKHPCFVLVSAYQSPMLWFAVKMPKIIIYYILFFFYLMQSLERYYKWIYPCFSSCDCKMPFSNYQQETEKNKGFLLKRPGSYTAHQEQRSKVTRGWAQRQDKAQGLGFCLYWGQGWGA